MAGGAEADDALRVVQLHEVTLPKVLLLPLRVNGSQNLYSSKQWAIDYSYDSPKMPVFPKYHLKTIAFYPHVLQLGGFGRWYGIPELVNQTAEALQTSPSIF